jgi:cytochrome c556
MTRLSHIAAGVALIAATMLSGVARADNQDIIDYREHVMKTLGEQAQSLAMVLQGKAPAENVVIHAQLLAVTAATVEKAFTPKVVGGEAKADVWAKWDDFSKKTKDLVAASNDLVKAAQAGGIEGAKAKMAAPGLGCKGCHDVYRDQKK